MELLGLVGVLLVLVLPALVIASFIMVLQQRSSLRALSRRLELVERGLAPAPAVETAPEPVAAAAPEEEPAVSPEEVEVEPEAVMPEPAEPVEPEPTLPPVPAKPGLEERLTSRWFVWVGAVALALAGLFLVKYSIEQGLLTPAARIGLGLVLGTALAAAGEWVRRRPSQRLIAAQVQDHAPGALVSGGIFTLFASILAAYRLYDLIGPGFAFAGLAFTAFAAFALSVSHGPIVAVIGLLAGFATPALIGSEEPSAWTLFTYLGLVVLASLAVVWHRKWGWLAFGSLAGAVVWVCLWLLGSHGGEGTVAVAAFLAVVTASILWLADAETPPDAPDIWRGVQRLGQPQFCAWIAAIAAAILLVWTVDRGGHTLHGYLVLGLAVLGLAIAGRWFERFDAYVIVAAATAVAAFAVAPTAGLVDAAARELAGADAPPYRGIIAPALTGYMVLVIAFAGLLAAIGVAILMTARRPPVWAAASVLGAALLLATAYWQLRGVTDDRMWAGLSAIAGLMAVGMVRMLNGRREHYGLRLSLGIYAAAVVAAVSFAFAFLFREAWFTIALSLMLPALAWIEEKLDLREMRLFALVVATAVLVRLAFNPYVLDYDATAPAGVHWVLYGYGIPAAAFYLASRLFLRRGEDGVTIALEGGALVFALLLVSLELRVLIAGRIDAPDLTLFEASLHSAVWLTAGWWRGRAYAASRRALDRWFSIVLIGLGVACVLFVQLIIVNPLFTDDPVGRLKVLDALLLGYLLPAILIFLILRDVRLGAPEWLRMMAAGGALALMLFWVSIETRHWFHGERLAAWRGVSDAESYAYSAVWLAFAFVLLGFGLWRRQATYRYGALAVMVAAVLKVFLIDMADLTGLYRVASFLGLGLSLVAIGLLYQRLVFAPPRVSPNTGTAGST